jgi:hypothetical protein
MIALRQKYVERYPELKEVPGYLLIAVVQLLCTIDLLYRHFKPLANAGSFQVNPNIHWLC